jgi:hypothetical protein
VNLYVQRTQLETRDKQAGRPSARPDPDRRVRRPAPPTRRQSGHRAHPLAPEGHRRSQILHSHLELGLTAALRARPDVITARILMPLDVTDRVMERPGRAHGLLGAVPGWNHTTLAPTAVV